MDEALVRARDVSRVFGSGPSAVEAVRGATFSVQPGDRVALVGPSGSGKSTLLHLIAALDRPTSGTIEWPALGTPDRLRPGPVAVAFQGQSLLPPLTVIENVALPILLAGGSETEARREADRLLELFGLEEVSSKLPEEISGGQAQRAAVARALTGEPRLVLADEPTGQQDHALARRVMEALLASAEQMGAAIVVATHDAAVADLLGTRWAMDGGLLRTAVAA
jgi:ABC-type lipoprotein export system ATPase subunit